MLHIALASALVACQSAAPEATAPRDTDPRVDTDVDTARPPEEVCNGVDDDGDGAIDEGSPDVDADGVADCVDGVCEVRAVAAGPVVIDSDCRYSAEWVADPWDLELEWESSDAVYTLGTPVFGLLSADAVPDIVVVGYWDSELHVVSGDGSGVICSAPRFHPYGTALVADIDGDGANDIVAAAADGSVVALEADCTLKWRTVDEYDVWSAPVATAADLDGDGAIEVICDTAVLDGATGAPIATLAPEQAASRHAPVVADVDLDGAMEIILGNTVFEADGTVAWSLTAASGTQCFSALIQADDDDEAEIVTVSANNVFLTHHDGALIRRHARCHYPSVPCAGDIDGDGGQEIVVACNDGLHAYDDDLSDLWTVELPYFRAQNSGCALFDADGDDVYEVVFADETSLHVFDGASGAELYSSLRHGSSGVVNTPTVGDVDGDGSAELVVGNSAEGVGTITVFGHASSEWPPAGPTWGFADYSVVNQSPDGSIPRSPEPSWLAERAVFRGRPAADVPGAANLGVSVVDVCASSCDPGVGVVGIAFQVENRGGVDAPSSTVAFYARDGDALRLLGTQPVPAVPAGTALASATFEVGVGDVGGGVRVVVDDDGAGGHVVRQCDRDDDAAEVGPLGCP